MLPVSAILPVSNRPRLFSEALASVLAQTCLPKEIVIVLNHDDRAVREADYAALRSPSLWHGASPSALPSELPTQKRLCVSIGTPRPALQESPKREGSRGAPVPRNAASEKKASPKALSPQNVTLEKDGTKEKIKFIIIQEADKIGPAPARNAGIQAATEPRVAFLDSDDLWEPEKLKKQWEFLQKRPHLRACHTAERWLKHGREIPQPLELHPRTGRFLVPSFRHCLISASSILIEKSLLLELGLFDEGFPLCEDYELWLRLLSKTAVGLVPEPLTLKRSGNWPQLSRSSHSLDLHRARALEKLLASGCLSLREKRAAKAELHRKRGIVEKGRRKREQVRQKNLVL